MKGRLNEWVNAIMNEGQSKWMSECNNEWINERMNKWMCYLSPYFKLWNWRPIMQLKVGPRIFKYHSLIDRQMIDR